MRTLISPMRSRPCFSASQRARSPRELLLLVGDLLPDLGEPLLRGLVGLLRDRQLLHPEPVDLALEHVDLHGATSRSPCAAATRTRP